jgi:hypothetical protein
MSFRVLSSALPLPRIRNFQSLMAGSLYAGTIAVRMRNRYPHLVDYVWAFSPPLAYTTDPIPGYDSDAEAVLNMEGRVGCDQNPSKFDKRLNG